MPPKVVDLLPALMRYARRLTGNESDAEDLVQDALVRAYANVDKYERGRPLRIWLFSILHNVFVSGTRRAAVRERFRADVVAQADPVEAPTQEQSVRLHQIEAALAALPEEQQAVLHLVAVEGLSYQDAAVAIGIPIGTLISRLSRARARLRALEDGMPAARPAQLRIVKD
ncbi:sigma-70 family RNA polymerase sigma factor [Sphingobium sp. AP49]|uniref:sigma-70 family RNA polymerase sigma factor n=1 Tax=Sphingobium sp. AP49 TaxID=1144307 RepID=UPI001EE66BA1|nr:sigma-70 family RNA polymerase sigma factor [Sphingobium sp. AP49]WHO37401.1 sigma-70 family RNA polymerase sigma factor [Sphingobium sp. AP49]